MSRHPDRDEIVGLVLGALDPDQKQQVTTHVEGCRKCSAEVRHYAPAVGVLAESVEQLEPPSELRSRLLETVRREADSPPESARAPTSAPRRSWLGGLRMRPAAGLAAVALVAAGLAGYMVAQGGDGEPATTVAAESTLPEAGGSLVVRGDESTLHVHGMPQLADKDAVYQVWVADGGAVRPSSNFVPAEDGTATVAVPEVGEGATEVMVTEEPEPNRSAPSGIPILRADA
jgi:anti-sigma-K factor RskA